LSLRKIVLNTKKHGPNIGPQNKAKKSGKIKEATEEKMKKLGCPPAQ